MKHREGAEVLILGMGRVGKGAYLTLKPDYGDKVWGIESDPERAAKLKAQGLSVVFGDADDMEFWQQVTLEDIRLVMLALPSQQEILGTMVMLGLAGYRGKVAAVARYEDERRELLDMGVDVVFNFYSEARVWFCCGEPPFIVGGLIPQISETSFVISPPDRRYFHVPAILPRLPVAA